MKWIAAAGADFAVSDRGQGLPLLLVHGFPLDHGMWREQTAALSDRCRVLAPDLRGFGATRAPIATDGVLSMEVLADDLAALLDALDVHAPVVLCGLSMGGYVAWQFARKHGYRLCGLVLCNTRAAADTPQAAQGRLDTARRLLAEGMAPVAEAMLPRLLASSTRQKRPELVDQVRSAMLAAPPLGAAAALRGMAERPDMTELLPRLRLPVLLVAGAHDEVIPADEMRGMAEQISGARLVVAPSAGHLAPLEDPAVVNAALGEFLGSVSQSRTATGS